MPLRRALTAAVLVSAALTTACAYEGGDIGNPFRRKAQWFSFVAGEDLAASCTAGSPDRFRLVYNALWEKQVRIYEWDAGGPLRIRSLQRGGNLIYLSLEDPLAPWRTEDAEVPLDAAARGRLTAALAEAGAFGPPAVGLELPSHSYYWTSASCRNGAYVFTGWTYPSAAYAAARFPAELAALDPGREAIARPEPVPVDPFREYDRKRGAVTEFTLKVGKSGLGL